MRLFKRRWPPEDPYPVHAYDRMVLGHPPRVSRLAVVTFAFALLPPAVAGAAILLGADRVFGPLGDEAQVLGLVVPCVTLLFSLLALSRINRSGGALRGGGIAVLALAFSALAVIPMVVLMLVAIASR